MFYGEQMYSPYETLMILKNKRKNMEFTKPIRNDWFMFVY